VSAIFVVICWERVVSSAGARAARSALAHRPGFRIACTRLLPQAVPYLLPQPGL